jgi:hypothetical protein
MAGISIVSAYMTIVARQLRITSIFHAEAGIFADFGDDGDCPPVLLDLFCESTI